MQLRYNSKILLQSAESELGELNVSDNNIYYIMFSEQSLLTMAYITVNYGLHSLQTYACKSFETNLWNIIYTLVTLVQEISNLPNKELTKQSLLRRLPKRKNYPVSQSHERYISVEANFDNESKKVFSCKFA